MSDGTPGEGDTPKIGERPSVPLECGVSCAAVLKRAKDILDKRPLPESHSEHGEYCPFCAISLAKGQLDDEHETGISFSEAMHDMAFGLTEYDSDLPLIEARKAINSVGIEEPFIKEDVQALFVTLTSN